METADPQGRRETETGTVDPAADAPSPETMPDVESAFEEIEVDAPRVGIIMGSKNDKPKMQAAGQALQDAGIRYEVRVMSAHRDPEKVREYCHNAQMRRLWNPGYVERGFAPDTYYTALAVTALVQE